MPVSPRYFAVYLPCKPYIKKYVESLYGETVPAHNRSSLGCFVNSCLVKEQYTNRAYSNSFIHSSFTDKLQFQVSAWAFARIGFDFPTVKVIELNQFLENRFEEHLYMWVDARYVYGKTERRKLIEEFAIKHGIEIEEHITLDALIKTEYRERVKIRKAANRGVKVAA